MEQIIYYKSKQGFTFTNERDCILFERKADQILEVMNSLEFLHLTQEEEERIRGQVQEFMSRVVASKLYNHLL